MPDWLDTDSFVTPARGPYRFATVPNFWSFLEQKATQGIIASSEFVLNELLEGDDALKDWAKVQAGKLFLPADASVQVVLRQIAAYVNGHGQYAPQHKAAFLGGADPWVIAHAKAIGGRVVTFERAEPTSRKPKIPDVAAVFGVDCINLWDLLTELNAQF